MEIRVAKIQNEQITIRPLLKSFYCPKCSDIRTCTPEKEHPNGFWFLLEVKIPISCYNFRFWVIDGWGKTQKQTFVDILLEPWQEVGSCPPLYYFEPSATFVKICKRVKDFAFKNYSKYFPLPCVIPYDAQLQAKIHQMMFGEEFKDFRVTPSDLVVIAKTLQANLVRKYHIFDQFSLSEFELAPEFYHLYPLLRVYKRAKTITLPSATIEEKPNSFTSIFKLNNSPLSVSIPKKRYTSPSFINNYFYLTSVDKKFIIAYSPSSSSVCCTENVNNNISLILLYDTPSSPPLRIPARIVNTTQLHAALDILFNYRLERFLFIPSHYQPFFSNNKIIFSYSPPYPSYRCDDLIVQNATLLNDNSIISPTSSAPILVQHKNHYIVLPPAQYELHSI